MVERYHLALAAFAGLMGLGVSVVDRIGPVALSRRSLGVVVAITMVLTREGWRATSTAVAVIGVVTAMALLVAEDVTPPIHPLGRWVAAMGCVSLVGIWASVPDTEAPAAAMCCLGPLALARAASGRGVGRSGWAALCVLIVSTAWIGSAGWGSARATACAVGAVLLAPLVLGLRPEPPVGGAMVALVLVHIGYALAVPRGIMRLEPIAATTLALASSALLALLIAAIGRTLPRREPPPPG